MEQDTNLDPLIYDPYFPSKLEMLGTFRQMVLME